jgi:hypothetical protein
MNGEEDADGSSCARFLASGTEYPSLGLQVILRRGDHRCVGHHLYVTTSFASCSPHSTANQNQNQNHHPNQNRGLADSLSQFLERPSLPSKSPATSCTSRSTPRGASLPWCVLGRRTRCTSTGEYGIRERRCGRSGRTWGWEGHISSRAQKR